MRYAITNLAEEFPDSATARLRRMRQLALQWTEARVERVQLREKPLCAEELLDLAKAALNVFYGMPGQQVPKLLINSRADVALAAGADGVHLSARPGELTPAQVRQVFAGRTALVATSCHTLNEIAAAQRAEVDFAVFGPVFGKSLNGLPVQRGTGLAQLQEACRIAGRMPVLALGGVRWADEATCRAAGAAGIAGIRLFARGPGRAEE